MNIDGSISGEDSQNAITAASGTPDASRAAITGMTPHEQNGDSAPIRLANTTIAAAFPAKARAIRFSAPLALA